MKRTLSLKSETLTELTSGELAALAGGVPPTRDCYTAGVLCFVSLAVCKVTDFEIGTLPTDGCV